MLIRLLIAVMIATSLLVGPKTSALSAPISIVRLVAVPAMFETEESAQRHCPRDVVVWLNILTGIYHEKGIRWYERTKHGAFVCKREADAAGDRDTRNGQ